MDVYRPRLLGGAYSARKVPAPAYSPEAEKPWVRRRSSRRSAAPMPSVEYPGRKAMRKVEPDMMRIDHDSAQRRPKRSPHAPQTTAPTGRRRKDIANTPKADIVSTVLSLEGKKTCPMTTAR